MTKCKARTATGNACKMPADKKTGYCFAHNPARAAERAQARRAGGLNRHTPHAGDPAKVIGSPRSIEDTFTILDYALSETLAADNGIPRNRLLVSIAAQYQDGLKTGVIETQLKELLAILATRPDPAK